MLCKAEAWLTQYVILEARLETAVARWFIWVLFFMETWRSLESGGFYAMWWEVAGVILFSP